MKCDVLAHNNATTATAYYSQYNQCKSKFFSVLFFLFLCRFLLLKAHRSLNSKPSSGILPPDYRFSRLRQVTHYVSFILFDYSCHKIINRMVTSSRCLKVWRKLYGWLSSGWSWRCSLWPSVSSNITQITSNVIKCLTFVINICLLDFVIQFRGISQSICNFTVNKFSVENWCKYIENN